MIGPKVGDLVHCRAHTGHLNLCRVLSVETSRFGTMFRVEHTRLNIGGVAVQSDYPERDVAWPVLISGSGFGSPATDDPIERQPRIVLSEVKGNRPAHVGVFKTRQEAEHVAREMNNWEPFDNKARPFYLCKLAGEEVVIWRSLQGTTSFRRIHIYNLKEKES